MEYPLLYWFGNAIRKQGLAEQELIAQVAQLGLALTGRQVCRGVLL